MTVWFSHWLYTGISNDSIVGAVAVQDKATEELNIY